MSAAQAQPKSDPRFREVPETVAFSQAVMESSPVRTPGEMGLADIRIILAILESLRQQGRPARVGGPMI